MRSGYRRKGDVVAYDMDYSSGICIVPFFTPFFPSTYVPLVFALQPSLVYCTFTHSHRRINIHTCSEVKGGSGGVGGEEKTLKTCVFSGPVSHYIGV